MKILSDELSLQEKLNILADAAKYDVACTSSGVDRRGQKGSLGNSCAAGICHSFASDGRCISLLKILQSNACVYDCKYCLNRSSNDRVRATFKPEEVCQLVIEFYRRNYIEGLFLSSGVCKNPSYTMELMYRTIYLLRYQYHFNGYIHVKAIPNAPEELLEQMGYLVDRMSINLELPTAEGLKKLAPHKTQTAILKPMGQIQHRIADYRLSIGKDSRMERSGGNRYLSGNIFDSSPKYIKENHQYPQVSTFHSPSSEKPAPFVPAGQSTQMIIGATEENDYQLLTTSQQLYQQYDLKRVFYSAYIPLNEDLDLPSMDTAPPLLREHRLYQADWLLRYYGFHAEELLSIDRPNFNVLLDPKCDWALRHLEQFPVEINRADYATLLKVPGIGTKSAMRIVKSRRTGVLTFDSLKKIGVVLKRAKYFITCQGRMMYHIRINEDFITRQLIGEDYQKSWEIDHPDSYRQLSLFDDQMFQIQPNTTDVQQTVSGQL
ncbi:putative DNA modification/repair radical SAM protein [Novisyntrophococcus fermenticellae]|uniref:putative DNA modification/repair radical SAM protein n=1 Tax=Novisyntrophococcus fermenticellae TaxID=2068655 RepID=UPI001E426277|nr:putative DNA modification/repair radical SAM protein [Novisyntrophococcus fermenticellae]